MSEPVLADYSRAAGTALDREHLSAARFVVVGAGALGNRVVETLGLLGAGAVLIVDPDGVEAANLPRSLLLREARAGQNKALALAESGARWFPETRFEALGCEVADAGLGRLRGAALIFSCTDSELARLETAYAAWQAGIPVCDAGLGAPNYEDARVSWLPGGEQACFGCLLDEGRRRQLLVDSASAPTRCGGGIAGGEAAPGVATVSAAAAALQVDFGLRWRQAMGSARAVEWRLDGEPQMARIELSRSAGCPFHGERRERRAAPGGDVRLGEVFAALGGEVRAILTDWPVCMRARCGACGEEAEPRRRQAWVRNRMRCGRCGEASMAPLRSEARIARGMWDDLKLTEAGLPEDHEFMVESTR